MASIHPTTLPSWSVRTDPTTNQFNPSNSLKLFSSSFNVHNLSSHSICSRFPLFDFTRCHCNNNDRGSSGNSDGSYGEEELNQRWDSALQELFRSAIKRFDDYLNSYFNRRSDSAAAESKGTSLVIEGKRYEDGVDDWDWERWQKHFVDIDEQERILKVLKTQLVQAVNKEDYEEAARLKVAIAAAATNDTVGQVISYLDKAVKEERYGDAAFLRDYAGTGLVGWWAGTSVDTDDPYGCIICISAEYGRYVARSYSPRQLVNAMDGAPLFEVFFTMNKKREYLQQAVYLKRRKDPPKVSIPPPKVTSAISGFDARGPTESKGDLLEETTEDTGDSGDEDSSFENTLRDLIPGVKVKVLKVTSPAKVDRDMISKVVEQIIEEEDEEQDFDLESVDAEDDDKGGNDDEQNDVVLDADTGISDGEDQSQIALKIVVDGLVSNFPSGPRHRDLLRVPARIEKKDHMSFTFTVEEDDSKHKSTFDEKAPANKKAKVQSQHSPDHVMLDLAKSIGKGRIPMKVLRDVSEMINLTLSQARNRQPLSGSTTFNRIVVPGTRDPLNGVYIGAHGLYTSEVIQLRRRFGQWKEEGRVEPPNLEFYEYVEAIKLTGGGKGAPALSQNYLIRRAGIPESTHYYDNGEIENQMIQPFYPMASLVYFQFTFAAITTILVAGSVLGRMNIKAWMAFVPLWLVFCYTVGAFSFWGGGFFFHWGVIDYSGGYVIHLSSGISGFTAAYWVGPRLKSDRERFPPNNVLLMLAGAGLLWMGWSGFNGGAPYAANIDSSIAVLNTNICAATSLLVWTSLDVVYFGKPSVIGAIQGMITGLACVTPGAGVVQPWAAIVMGILSGSIPWFSMMILHKKSILLQKVDDTLAVFYTHGVAGILGGLLTGLLAEPTLCRLILPVKGTKGAFYGGGTQILKQLVGALFVVGWNFLATTLILLFIKLFIALRMPDDQLMIGDDAVHGEEAYALWGDGEKFDPTEHGWLGGTATAEELRPPPGFVNGARGVTINL